MAIGNLAQFLTWNLNTVAFAQVRPPAVVFGTGFGIVVKYKPRAPWGMIHDSLPHIVYVGNSKVVF
jgi:hypothetical protein